MKMIFITLSVRRRGEYAGSFAEGLPEAGGQREGDQLSVGPQPGPPHMEFQVLGGLIKGQGYILITVNITWKLLLNPRRVSRKMLFLPQLVFLIFLFSIYSHLNLISLRLVLWDRH